MRNEPNLVSLCGRGDSDPHAPFGAPDPKSSTAPRQAPKQGLDLRTEPAGTAGFRIESVTLSHTYAGRLTGVSGSEMLKWSALR